MSVFVKAADLGSFTAAAAALGLSAQMVGKHVGALEERLGSELIRRTTRRQSLTSVGQAFYERCRTILAETEAAEALAADLSATPRGRLRINAPVIFGASCVAPLVGAYLDRYPDVSVELSLTDRYVDLVDEGFDLAIRLGALEDSSLLSRKLAPYRLIACAATNYLERRGTPATPDDLAAHDCLGFVYSTGLALDEWEFTAGDGETHRVRLRSRFQCNDARVLHAAALDGRGILLLSNHVVSEDLASRRLVRVLPDYAAPVRPMHLLFSSSRRQTPALRGFIDLMTTTFG